MRAGGGGHAAASPQLRGEGTEGDPRRAKARGAPAVISAEYYQNKQHTASAWRCKCRPIWGLAGGRGKGGARPSHGSVGTRITTRPAPDHASVGSVAAPRRTGAPVAARGLQQGSWLHLRARGKKCAARAGKGQQMAQQPPLDDLATATPAGGGFRRSTGRTHARGCNDHAPVPCACPRRPGTAPAPDAAFSVGTGRTMTWKVTRKSLGCSPPTYVRPGSGGRGWHTVMSSSSGCMPLASRPRRTALPSAGAHPAWAAPRPGHRTLELLSVFRKLSIAYQPNLHGASGPLRGKGSVCKTGGEGVREAPRCQQGPTGGPPGGVPQLRELQSSPVGHSCQSRYLTSDMGVVRGKLSGPMSPLTCRKRTS